MAEWVEREVHDANKCQIEQWQSAKCTACGLYHTTPFLYYFKEYKFCPNCGEPMGKGETMRKDISVEKLIKCAEMHLNFNAECGGCDYKDYDDCVEVMLADAITIIKAGYREACKVENSPIDARKEAEPINVSAENKRSLMPMIEAYSVEWYEEGVTHCPQFTDIENAIKFADKVMHDKPKVDMVTIRRSEW